MTESKILGRIEKASFGCGGYQNAMIGLSLTLASPGSVWDDFWGTFPPKPGDENKDTAALMVLGTCCLRLSDILTKAKVTSVDNLVGVPVEITLNGRNTLKSWRVLEEVL